MREIYRDGSEHISSDDVGINEPQKSLDEYSGVIVRDPGIMMERVPLIKMFNAEAPECGTELTTLMHLAYNMRGMVGPYIEVKDGKYRIMDELYQGW